MKFYFKQMLKVSVFYLEKQISFIPKKKFLAAVSKHANIIPKNGPRCPNFQWRFWLSPFPHYICSMANFQINILRNTKASYLNQIEFSSKHLFPVTVDYLRSFDWQAFDCCFPFRELGAWIGIEIQRFPRKERT